VIPNSEERFKEALPVQASFWMPSEQEILDDTALGFFHDVWILVDVDAAEARAVVTEERQILDYLDSLANTADEFEELATAVESADPDSLDHKRFPADSIDENWIRRDDFPPLEGLEVGVAGLSYALAAMGCVPQASCRGHLGRGAWSPYPVVYVAIDEPRARRLEALVADTGCGFCIDPERSELLVVAAASITSMSRLAEALLTDLAA
jgi:hypothetical protein